MTCCMCGREALPGFASYTVDEGSYCIVVKNVPCDICTHCGEKYYDPDVSLRLEEIVREAKKVLENDVVISYSAA